MEQQTPKVRYLKDYLPSDFLIASIFLHFDLHDDYAIVKSILNIHRNEANQNQLSADLVLDGVGLELKQILLNGVVLKPEQYKQDEYSLTLFKPPAAFSLEIEVKIEPQRNTQLSGLYRTGQQFCTQCESEGFRRITYFLDRPDVLVHFTTTITANKEQYPTLLANGNLTDSRELENDRHWVKWEDPIAKPCYLFALVAGNLEVLEDTFITQSDRQVQLKIFIEAGKREQARFAMSALKMAMRWDEEVYGREYDLDIYMIVAVSDFNFGAMENKGLNIFNDRYILAKPETATDEDFINVQAVVGHEYFHNWSGNRVTVRDWFQITLKEGLTVFREHQFTADNTSHVVKRIQEVKTIRSTQFAQDASPMAHPIQPDSYMEVTNFYTVTVYEKGSEVIRMLYTLLGAKTFREAMDLYFSRNDGKPVTVHEFVQAMADVSQLDLTQFKHWYEQAGTPVLQVQDDYDPATQVYTLSIQQICPPTPGQSEKKAFHIPFALGLLDSQGQELSLQLNTETKPSESRTRVLNIKQFSETFQFINIPHKPVPSLLRHFSAPVKLRYDYSEDNLIFLMSHDPDAFNRWDASQQLAIRILLRLINHHQENTSLVVPENFIAALEKVFKDSNLDEAVIAEILTLPSENYLMEEMAVVDPDAIHWVREWLQKQIAIKLQKPFAAYYHQHKHLTPYGLEAKEIAGRRLKNAVLSYLTLLGGDEIYQTCLEQFYHANNMTDVMGAMTALNNVECEQRQEAITAFYQRWQNEALVVNKWFSLQAQSSLPNTLKVVQELVNHPAFDLKNPNSARSLLGSFALGNPYRFHQIDGKGYTFLADYVLKIDRFNPQLAARILEPLIHWKKFAGQRPQLMKEQLERIAATPKLSRDIYEIVSKSLK